MLPPTGMCRVLFEKAMADKKIVKNSFAIVKRFMFAIPRDGIIVHYYRKR
jgi:hypothetical protein